MADQARGCLYDGSAEIKTFDEQELQHVKEAIDRKSVV